MMPQGVVTVALNCSQLPIAQVSWLPVLVETIPYRSKGAMPMPELDWLNLLRMPPML